jgi:hypothetical protein
MNVSMALFETVHKLGAIRTEETEKNDPLL